VLDVNGVNPEYYPNPRRAVYVQGVIDENLLYRLTPEIISLQAQSREPITVYINSRGGSTRYMEALLDLLRASSISGQPSCRLTTVAVSQAASAAADLLSAGHHALAYPDCLIVYHGVRETSDKPLTVEETSTIVDRLKGSNEGYAIRLANRADFRAMWRFTSLKDKYDEVREEQKNKQLSNLRCFALYLKDKLSDSGNDVLERARERYGRYNAVLNFVAQNTKSPSEYKTRAGFEAAQIKAIIKLEQRINKGDKDWGFLSDGINRLTDDFFLLHEYLRTLRSNRFKLTCDLWKEFWLTEEELDEIANLPERERLDATANKMHLHLLPMWSLFVALCHILQYGENQLTAEDAFWLGLIDDVIGVEGLPSLRRLSEQARKLEEQEQQENEEVPTPPPVAEGAAGA
jgi:ATP-dependent protease ClpP protease subunit